MFMPGLTYFDAIQNQLGTPVIRGISQTNLNSPDRNVAVFYGGVYLANQNTSNLELLDVERIEVVKGPAIGALWPQRLQRRHQLRARLADRQLRRQGGRHRRRQQSLRGAGW